MYSRACTCTTIPCALTSGVQSALETMAASTHFAVISDEKGTLGNLQQEKSRAWDSRSDLKVTT